MSNLSQDRLKNPSVVPHDPTQMGRRGAFLAPMDLQRMKTPSDYTEKRKRKRNIEFLKPC